LGSRIIAAYPWPGSDRRRCPQDVRSSDDPSVADEAATQEQAVRPRDREANARGPRTRELEALEAPHPTATAPLTVNDLASEPSRAALGHLIIEVEDRRIVVIRRVLIVVTLAVLTLPGLAGPAWAGGMPQPPADIAPPAIAVVIVAASIAALMLVLRRASR
jgi:hypothetical protein